MFESIGYVKSYPHLCPSPLFNGFQLFHSHVSKHQQGSAMCYLH